ncbi:MAG: bifunctional 5,10-methylenetetrahydrofolate dehydrogenase/5,10-methenyltetrahydrofolate cyclohydrolase [Candidatus Saccharimonadales bacterium]
MKYLSGSELVSYIKVRQAKQVRVLRQAHNIHPKLAIVQTNNDPVINTYVRLKKQYGEDVLIDVEHVMTSEDEILAEIDRLNEDPTVHAIIVQLPLADQTLTDTVLERVSARKDVDGLSSKTQYDPATALAINWLCAGYNIDMHKQTILVVGQGRLVGAPLTRMWQNSGYNVQGIDKADGVNLEDACSKATLIVSGAGVPGLIRSNMIRPDTIVIDAGTASESGKIAGDIDPEVYNRDDIMITPQKGGVGPLTVAALFDNVIRASHKFIQA